MNKTFFSSVHVVCTAHNYIHIQKRWTLFDWYQRNATSIFLMTFTFYAGHQCQVISRTDCIQKTVAFVTEQLKKWRRYHMKTEKFFTDGIL